MRKGIIKSREEAAGIAQQDEIVEELIEKARAEAPRHDPLAGKSLKELDNMAVGGGEDGVGAERASAAATAFRGSSSMGVDDEDDWAADEQDARKFLESYREKRLAEMKREAKAAKFGGKVKGVEWHPD